MKALILGAGGHGQTVAEALIRIATSDYATHAAGFLDDTPELQDWRYQGIPVLGPMNRLAEISHDRVIVAIGDNHARRQVFLQLEEQGVKHVYDTIPAK